MSQLRVSGRNVASVVCLAALLMYIAYFTSELYTRLNNIKKFERLNQYDKELTELTRLLQQYKVEARSVGASVSLLHEVVSKMAVATKVQRLQGHEQLQSHQRELLIRDQEALLNRPMRYEGGLEAQRQAQLDSQESDNTLTLLKPQESNILEKRFPR